MSFYNQFQYNHTAINVLCCGFQFSAKKFWEVDDGHVSDGKGAMFTASSPWSPRQSTWSSPTAGTEESSPCKSSSVMFCDI